MSIIKATLVQSIPALCGVIVASVVFPLILPILPFKPFSLKGATLSLIFVSFWFWTMNYLFIPITLYLIGYSFVISALITNISLNFTGSTTYTSFSGVVKETLWALPLCILSAVIGVAIMIIAIV